jgi:hypothetical protein
LRKNADVIDKNIKAINRWKAPPAPQRDPRDASGADNMDFVPLPVPPDPVSPSNQPHA